VASADDRRSERPRNAARSETALAIGVEIGGRGLRVAVASQSGRLLETASAIGGDTTAAGTVETVAGLIDQLLARRRQSPSDFAGVGVAFGGPVDSERGVTIRSHRIQGFEQFPLVGVLEERFGIPIVLENDARAAAFGELKFGAGRGAVDLVYLHLGRGVGGAVIIGGRIQHGASMTSGEFGHMVVATNGPRCSCGKPGHLEAYASEPAIVSRMQQRLADAAPDVTARWLTSEGITVRRIFEESTSDPDAASVTEETVHVIGLAAANLVTALNPDALVFGGHVVEVGHDLVASIRTRIRQYAFDAAARRVAVAASQLGADSGLIGAAVLALTR
jgi:glucokinase